MVEGFAFKLHGRTGLELDAAQSSLFKKSAIFSKHIVIQICIFSVQLIASIASCFMPRFSCAILLPIAQARLHSKSAKSSSLIWSADLLNQF